MSETDRLPDLPLLLAGLPRGVRDVLRTAGVPVRTLSGAVRSGCGRFLLFDGRRASSRQQARLAASLGLMAIDVSESRLPEEDLPLSGAQATAFLLQLKERLEGHRGLWLRISDYPFPFESALCLSAEHRIEDLPELARFKELLPGAVTHFVSTRLRGDWLTYVSLVAPGEIGWRVDSGELLETPRKTRSHWGTRKRRFEEAGLPVSGLRLVDGDLPLPGRSALRNLGLSFGCHGWAGEAGSVQTEAEWVRLGTVSLEGLAASRPGPPRFAGVAPEGASTLSVPPPHFAGFWESDGSDDDPDNSSILRALVTQHRAGRPVFVHGPGNDPGVIAQFLLLKSGAARLPLMWQTTFGEFAHWWLRRHLDIQAWQTESGCEIRAAGDVSNVPRSIELWRGQHRAVLPLAQPTLSVRDDGIAYVQTPDRNPAGLAALPDRNSRGLSAFGDPLSARTDRLTALGPKADGQ